MTLCYVNICSPFWLVRMSHVLQMLCLFYTFAKVGFTVDETLFLIKGNVKIFVAESEG